MKHGRPMGDPDHFFMSRNRREVSMSHEFVVGWRREHAHRVWQAMQAVVAVAVAFQEAFHEAYNLRVDRLEQGTKRERAHRSWAAMQAVLAVAAVDVAQPMSGCPNYNIRIYRAAGWWNGWDA